MKKIKHIKNLLLLILVLCACEPEGLIPPKNIVVDTDDETESYEQYGTPYDNVPDAKDVVAYEVNIRAFSANGDLQGVIDNLDHIKSLGVNTIWLMPIYPVGEVNSAGGLGSPYSVKNYLEVNEEFGTLETLRSLVDTAHEMNMAVILDWVANHTAWDNPWISNTAWYTLDDDGNIISPEGTDWTDVADLNYDNDEMREAMIDAMKYWVLEANVDGFRCDAVDYVPSDFWSQAWGVLTAIEGRDLILLAEAGATENFESGFTLNYAWDFYTSVKNVFSADAKASTVFTTNESEYSGIGEGVKLRYITNHDVYAWDATPITEYESAEGSLAAFVITAYLEGAPLIYSGQEVANPELISFFYKSAIDWTQNPNILQGYKDVMQVRNASEAIRHGSITRYDDDDVVAFKKASDSEAVLILVNTRSTATTFALPEALQNTTWENAMDSTDVSLQNEISLDAFAYKILLDN